jgi:hypothetical protein
MGYLPGCQSRAPTFGVVYQSDCLNSTFEARRTNCCSSVLIGHRMEWMESKLMNVVRVGCLESSQSNEVSSFQDHPLFEKAHSQLADQNEEMKSAKLHLLRAENVKLHREIGLLEGQLQEKTAK